MRGKKRRRGGGHCGRFAIGLGKMREREEEAFNQNREKYARGRQELSKKISLRNPRKLFCRFYNAIIRR